MRLADASGEQEPVLGMGKARQPRALRLVAILLERLIDIDQHVVPLRPPGDLLEIFDSENPPREIGGIA